MGLYFLVYLLTSIRTLALADQYQLLKAPQGVVSLLKPLRYCPHTQSAIYPCTASS
ncbi:protein of unknown function [Alcaligenes faecalis subsp. faecalis]|nr:protein of unknown function [Alcaligenes faecalis subsp. faecalis]